MDYLKYVEGALRTESTLNPLTTYVEDRGLSNRLYHSILGMSTEVSEMYDAVELELLDFVNLLEEIGDAHWYLAIAADDLNITKDISNELNTLHSNNVPGLLVSLATLRKHSANLLDYTKKVMFYGKLADRGIITTNVIAIARSLNYLTRAITDDVDINSKIFAINLAKLKARYPDKFNGFSAEVRDLKAERLILEELINVNIN